MNKNQLAAKVLDRLKARYPDLKTALVWKTPWQLLVATVLSAQCTDRQVNKITPLFFQKWPTPFDLVQALPEEVALVIRSAGFYRAKSKSLVGAASSIVKDFGGKVPSCMRDLVSLPGVGRKTANIVLSGAFGINKGIAVDTHVKRISFRLGLAESVNPEVVEKELMPLFPREEWANVNHMLVFFGRDVCRARKPVCCDCELKDICHQNGVQLDC